MKGKRKWLTVAALVAPAVIQGAVAMGILPRGLAPVLAAAAAALLEPDLQPRQSGSNSSLPQLEQ